MKRLYSNVGSTKAALQQRPEIFHALHVNLTVNVLLKMVHELMFVFRFEIVVPVNSSVIIAEPASTKSRTAPCTAGYLRSPITLALIFPPRSSAPMTTVLPCPPCIPMPSLKRRRFDLCILRALPPM